MGQGKSKQTQIWSSAADEPQNKLEYLQRANLAFFLSFSFVVVIPLRILDVLQGLIILQLQLLANLLINAAFV